LILSTISEQWLKGTFQKIHIWRATTKIWRGLSKFTIWKIVGGRDIGATVPLQTGNEPIGEVRGHALRYERLFLTK
jgi:hypothetical protein